MLSLYPLYLSLNSFSLGIDLAAWILNMYAVLMNLTNLLYTIGPSSGFL